MRNRHALIAVVALTAFSIQGCHDSPTAPLPEDAVTGSSQPVTSASAKKGGPNGGGSAGVEMQGGMVGSSQTVAIQKDSQRELNLQGPYVNAVAMASTWAMRSAVCSVQKGNPSAAEQEALLEKLLDPSQERFRAVMVVDRSGTDHRLTLNWTDEASSAFEGLVLNVTDGVAVTESPVDTFTFSGGDVLIQDKRGKVKDRVTMRCQNLDTITVILDR